MESRPGTTTPRGRFDSAAHKVVNLNRLKPQSSEEIEQERLKRQQDRVAAIEERRKTLADNMSLKSKAKPASEFPQTWCDYDETNLQYKTDLAKFSNKAAKRATKAEYDKYRAEIEYLQDIKLKGVKLAVGKDGKPIKVDRDNLDKDRLLNLFFVKKGSVGLYRRNAGRSDEGSLDFKKRFKDLRDEVTAAKNMEEVNAILTKGRQRPGQQTLVNELLAEAMSQHDLEGKKRLPFTFYKWIMLSEIALIESQIEIMNPLYAHQSRDARPGEEPKVSHDVAFFFTERDSLLFGDGKAAQERGKASFLRQQAVYTAWAQENITPVVSPKLACLKQLEMLHDSGTLNVALQHPALREFHSRVDGVNFGDELLSRKQIVALEGIDNLIIENREKKAARKRLGKVMLRAGTGAGKSHLEALIAEKYAAVLEVRRINLNSSEQELDLIFDGNQPFNTVDKDLLITLDEATFYGKYFRKKFLANAPENFGLRGLNDQGVEKTLEELAQEVALVEGVILRVTKKLRDRGANLFILGASESIDKVDFAECVRLDVEYYEEGRRLDLIDAGVSEIKKDIKKAVAGLEGVKSFNLVMQTGGAAAARAEWWTQNSSQRTRLRSAVKDLAQAGIIDENQEVCYLGQELTPEAEEANQAARDSKDAFVRLGLLQEKIRLQQGASGRAGAKKLLPKDIKQYQDNIAAIVNALGRSKVLDERQVEELRSAICKTSTGDNLTLIAQNVAAFAVLLNEEPVVARRREVEDAYVEPATGIIGGGPKAKVSRVGPVVVERTAEAAKEIAAIIAESAEVAGMERRIEDNKVALAEIVGKKEANKFFAEVGVEAVAEEKSPPKSRKELQEDRVEKRRVKLEDRKTDLQDLRLARKVAQDKFAAVVPANFTHETAAYNENSLAALVSGYAQDIFEGKKDQRVQYILPDFDIQDTTCALQDFVQIQKVSGADIIIVPHVINVEEDRVDADGSKVKVPVSKMGCRVFYRTVAGGTDFTLEAISADDFDSTRLKEISDKIGGRPNIISFFGGPNAEQTSGGNVVGGNYPSSLGTTQQIIHVKDCKKYGWTEWMQWVGRNRNPSEDKWPELRVITHGEASIDDFRGLLGENTAIHEQAHTLAHLRVKVNSVQEAEAGEDRDMSKSVRNDWILQDYVDANGRGELSITKYIEEQRKGWGSDEARQEQEARREMAKMAREESAIAFATYAFAREATMERVATAFGSRDGSVANLDESTMGEIDESLLDAAAASAEDLDEELDEDSQETANSIKAELDRFNNLDITEKEDFFELVGPADADKMLITSDILRFEAPEEGTSRTKVKVGGETYAHEKPFNCHRMRFSNMHFLEVGGRPPIFGEGAVLHYQTCRNSVFEGVDFSKVANFETWKFIGCQFVDCTFPQNMKAEQFATLKKKSGEKIECKFFKTFLGDDGKPILEEGHEAMQDITLEVRQSMETQPEAFAEVPSANPGTSRVLGVSKAEAKEVTWRRLRDPNNPEHNPEHSVV